MFFFNDTATTEIYTLSLHDALPISRVARAVLGEPGKRGLARRVQHDAPALHVDDAFADGERPLDALRSEEHTSELQSRQYLVCRLLLEKKQTMSPPSSCPPNSLSAR